ncbi:MAG: bifunctional phosphoribosyl-AMP cyclohydrolase/phosphoribosyl-ATP diphosphatase HisIE [Gemmatimonadales bacterium]|nr:MAG: bifunctional phosphoribosyl-AMP cyclohydrolase/phosphoribosyl-ATP diphosphatase HisIE [Gemmatimonadales bacterium]
MERVRFDPDGLAPVVVQDARNGDVLMLAWANREALAETRATGRAHFWSRSRGALWRKGETSGHEQKRKQIRLDCDGDTVLYRVIPSGPSCHTGQRTCCSSVVRPDGGLEESADPGGHLLTRLSTLLRDRAASRPPGSYTVELLDQGVPGIAKKVGEEAVEVVVAATTEDDGRLASETADLLYHLLVLLTARGLPPDAVWQELQTRLR